MGGTLRPLLVAISLLSTTSLAAFGVEVEAPRVAFSGATTSIILSNPSALADETLEVVVETDGGFRETVLLTGGEPADVSVLLGGGESLRITPAPDEGQPDLLVLPGWLTLLPPLVAIAVALVTRQVVVSLLAGILLGALFLRRFDLVGAFDDTLDKYVVGSLADDSGHVFIVFIAAILGGMSGVLSRSGGARAIVEKLARRAVDRRGAQLSTWLMGLVVFFDDYANTLIVGNMMRPLTDRLRVSREKLAFLVDSTAAPVASIAPISTWIGFEVGLLDDALTGLAFQMDGYTLFLASIPYRFYPIFALALGLFLVLSQRDYGAMRAAEERAANGELLAKGAEPLLDTSLADRDEVPDDRAHASNALLPILVVIVVTLGGILLTGLQSVGDGDRSLRSLIAAGDSYQALLWAGALGSLVAVALAVARRSLSLAKAMGAWVDGIRAMTMAVVILVLAWGIGAVCRDVGTADVLVGYLGDRFPVALLPAGVFVISALVSFSTGTSWGTMAILVPIVVPLGAAIGGGSESALAGAVSGVLAGSVFGDHCSPISDTTVLSSLASGSDHVDHVRTQLPYAMTAAIVAIVVGDLLTGIGFPVWGSLLLGTAALYLIVRWRGRRLPSTAS